MTRDTCCTSIPRDHTSVVMRTRLAGEGGREGGRRRERGRNVEKKERGREEGREGTEWKKRKENGHSVSCTKIEWNHTNPDISSPHLSPPLNSFMMASLSF